ncbi:MAG TPA: DUF1538 domain-containing protein [Actinobacteria bacterium]|jgi:hypothetical protein|nr:DUF1538 domain-containing protein [Actinomycetota bacterium]
MNEFTFSGFLNLVLEILLAIAPLFFIFIIFQIFVFKLSAKRFLSILTGFVMVFFGLILFLLGVEIGFVPVGNFIGKTIGGSTYNWLLIPIGFALGFVVTFMEPGVRILCTEIEKCSSGFIREKHILLTLSFGVAVAVALAMAKTIFAISLTYILLPGYLLAFIFAFMAGPTFTSIAFDSGGVATGPMSVTFILSISLGAAIITEGADPILHGFGLISIVALAPIIAVLVFGIIFKRKGGDIDG